PRPRFVTGTTHQWPIGLLDPTRPPLPLPRPTIPPKATSRDPAARRRTRALWGLCPSDRAHRSRCAAVRADALPPHGDRGDVLTGGHSPAARASAATPQNERRALSVHVEATEEAHAEQPHR